MNQAKAHLAFVCGRENGGHDTKRHGACKEELLASMIAVPVSRLHSEIGLIDDFYLYFYIKGKKMEENYGSMI
jgi:hypothetical protein